MFYALLIIQSPNLYGNLANQFFEGFGEKTSLHLCRRKDREQEGHNFTAMKNKEQ